MYSSYEHIVCSNTLENNDAASASIAYNTPTRNGVTIKHTDVNCL